MKSNRKIENKIDVETVKVLKNYMIFELDNIIQSLRELKVPDVKGIFFIILFILEILFLFILPKILINKQKKNMKSALTVLSLIMGLILAIFYSEFTFFFKQKTIVAVIMVLLTLILAVLLIKKDIKNIQTKILEKVEEGNTEILEKTKFFSAVILYSDIVKVLTMYLLLMLIIK